ncbi:hypothetical protein Tco_0759867 [Tanacetum coccineum]
MYDISATYGISHWWFRRQKFYIDRHSAETNRRAIVRTHMRILSVVSIDVFSIYGSPEPPTAKGQEDSLLCCQPMNQESGYKSYQTQLNLTKPRWEATGLEFMHDYKILDSPRAVLFRDKYGMQMLMRFNEIHKFSDGTLQQIDEALDYRVKEFKVNKNNLALNTSSRESSGTWKALLVEEYTKETIDFYGELNDDILSVDYRTSSEESSGTWRALLVEEYEKETTDIFREQNDDIFSVTFSTSYVVGPHGFEGSYKDGDDVNLFQQNQVHSHMLILKTQ